MGDSGLGFYSHVAFFSIHIHTPVTYSYICSRPYGRETPQRRHKGTQRAIDCYGTPEHKEIESMTGGKEWTKRNNVGYVQ